MGKLRCGKCGSFVSSRFKYLFGCTTGILIMCWKCKSVLSLQEYIYDNSEMQG